MVLSCSRVKVRRLRKPIAPSGRPDSLFAQVKKPTRPGSPPSPAAQSVPVPPPGAQAARVKPTPTPTPTSSPERKPVVKRAVPPVPATQPTPKQAALPSKPKAVVVRRPNPPAKSQPKSEAAQPTPAAKAVPTPKTTQPPVSSRLKSPESPRIPASKTEPIAVSKPKPAADPARTAKSAPAAISKPASRKPAATRPATTTPSRRRVTVAAPATNPPVEPPPLAENSTRSPVGAPPALTVRPLVPRTPLPPLPALLLSGDPKLVIARPLSLVSDAVEILSPAFPPAALPPGDPVPEPPCEGPGPSAPVTPAPFVSAAPPWRGSVWILARDPFTLVVHWDLPSAVLDAARTQDPCGEWRLRVWQEFVGGRRVADQSLPLDTTHRFVPVVVSGAGYVAEIGFLEGSGHWRGCAMSQPVVAPSDTAARSSTSQRDVFPEFRGHAGPVHPVMLLGSASDRDEESPAGGHRAETRGQPTGATSTRDPWVVLEALERILHRESRVADLGSSEQATEWSAREELRRDRQVAPSPAPAPVRAPGLLPLPSSAAWLTGAGAVVESPSSAETVSPARPSSAPGFWFRINAEVILYGSTERDAQLTIAGRPVALREDGSFSFRFLLPDGRFDLPVIAVNATRTDGRSAAVTFSRATSVRGEVGVHPAPPGLKPPVPDAI